MNKRDKSLGQILARALAGSWRENNRAVFDLSESELDQITPLLLGSGAAALGWRRVSSSELRESPSAELLRQAFRLQSLQSELQEQTIAKVFRLLRESGLDGLLAKGWAAAGLYYDRTLRPFGDIDVLVSPEHYRRARDLFHRPEAVDCWVDLHRRFSEIGNRTVADLFAKSKLVAIAGEQARILGDEDHVALLCIHFLKHGAWRPLWLCDVAVAIESASPAFDWNRCLGTDPTRANWIKSTFALANQLLGARTDSLPFALDPLPAWLLETVLRQWSNPYAAYQAPMNHPVPMTELLRRPSGLVGGLRERWPNPILATISVHGRLNQLPRLPYQVANCITRVVRLVIRGSELQED